MLPNGIVRGNRINITPLVLYEAISVGVADLIDSDSEGMITSENLQTLLNSEDLKRLTTGATNSRNKLLGRIENVKNFILNAI